MLCTKSEGAKSVNEMVRPCSRPAWPRRAYVGFTSDTWRSTRTGTEAAIEPDLWLALAKPRFSHAAAALSATSSRAEGEAGALLQALAQRRPHQRARRPCTALALHVTHEAESALGDHLAGRAVAGVEVARDYHLGPSAIRQLAQEEDVVEAPSRALPE